MGRALACVARLGCGAALLALIVWRWGAEPFTDALGRVDARSLTVAATVTGLTTLCCAWRWSVVATGLDVRVRLPAAIAAYYRSQFLNTTLPGGVVGDAHRAIRHGRDVGAIGPSLRSVAWERALGQGVQIVVTVAVLIVLPSPMRTAAVVVVLVGMAGIGLLVAARITFRSLPVRGTARGRTAHITQAAVRISREGRRILLARRAWQSIVLASLLAATGHIVVFLVAMSAAGVDASTSRTLPVALIVLQASAIPANVAGWGPREGVAAWTFGSAGLGAAEGVTVAALYGMLALVGTLPVLAVLVAGRLAAPGGAGARLLPLRCRFLRPGRIGGSALAVDREVNGDVGA